MCLKAQKICQVRVRKRVYTGRFQPSVTILFQHQKHLNQILCSDFEYFLQILKLKIDFLPQIEYTERRKYLGGFAMLLQFSVTNHRSIKDTAIISMKASTDKSLSDCLISSDGKKQLVPVLALYGANAAGKSNVLHALLLMREMVCGRYAKLLKGETLPQEP